MLAKSKPAPLFEQQCCGLSPWMPVLIQELAVAVPGLGTSPPGGLLGPSQHGPALEEAGPAGCQQPGWGCSWQFCPASPCASTAALCSSPHTSPVPMSSDTAPTLCPAPCLGAAGNNPSMEQGWASKRCSLDVSSEMRFLWNLCVQVLLRGMLKLLWPDMHQNLS